MKWILPIAFIILSCSRVPPVPRTDVEKKIIPVFEVFGYARCSNCPLVEHATDSLKALYKDSVSILEYHLRLLGDTLSPEEINTKTELYNIQNTAPCTIIQGTRRIDGAEDSEETQLESFKSYYNALRAQKDSVGLYLTTDTMNDTIIITLDADSIMNIDTLKDVIFLSITEDSVFFQLSGAEDSIYNNVVREMKLLPSTLPQTLSFSKEYLRQKHLIMMLQDTVNKNIISVAQRRF